MNDKILSLTTGDRAIIQTLRSMAPFEAEDLFDSDSRAPVELHEMRTLIAVSMIEKWIRRCEGGDAATPMDQAILETYTNVEHPDRDWSGETDRMGPGVTGRDRMDTIVSLYKEPADKGRDDRRRKLEGPMRNLLYALTRTMGESAATSDDFAVVYWLLSGKERDR